MAVCLFLELASIEDFVIDSFSPNQLTLLVRFAKSPDKERGN
jgi:hypothetical protein